MTYSLEFRRQVMRVKQVRGLSHAETCELFNIGKDTLVRWHRKIEPMVKRAYRLRKLDREAILEDVKKYPDAYQYERAQRLGVSQPSIHFALKRLGITRKKRRMNTPKLTDKSRNNL